MLIVSVKSISTSTSLGWTDTFDQHQAKLYVWHLPQAFIWQLFNRLNSQTVISKLRQTSRQARMSSRDEESSKYQTLSGLWGDPHVFRKLAQLYRTWLWGLASARLHRAAAAALRNGRGPVVRMLTKGRMPPSEATAAAMSRRPGQYIKAWSAPAAAACCCTLPVPTHYLTLQGQRNSTIAHHSTDA